MSRVKVVFAFPNGMIAACGYDGQQIPELQGPALEVIGKVLAEVDARTEMKGVIDLQTVHQQIIERARRGGPFGEEAPDVPKG